MILHPERLIGLEITLVSVANKIAERTERQLNRNVIIIEGFRSPETQHQRYLQGRFGDTRKIISNADSGHSPHEYHCGVDLWVMSEDGKEIDWNNKEFLNIIQEECVASNGQVISGSTFSTIKDDDHLENQWWRDVRAGTRKIIPHTTQST